MDTMLTTLRVIITGYARIVKNILVGLLLCLAIAAACALVVWPLWLFATNSPHLYGLFVALLCLSAGLWYTARAVRRSVEISGSSAAWTRTRLRPALIRGGAIVFAVSGAGLSFLILSRSGPVFFLPAAAVYGLVLGYLLFAVR